MTEATELAALVSTDVVDRALGLAAASGKFATGDLSSIVDHISSVAPEQKRLLVPDEKASLQRGTRSWAGFGR